MSSGLAIVQQTKSAIQIIKQDDPDDPLLIEQSKDLEKFKNQFLTDGGIADLIKII